jgi:hypothetical protein
MTSLQAAKAIRGARHRNTNMCRSDDTILQHYGDYITSALQTEGGHLSIGRGGFTLRFGRGARLSGYDCESFKTCCIAAGLPVIDSRMVALEDVVRLAVRGPMVAVGEEVSPRPYHALSFAPLCVVAQAYRAAGAEVFNIPALASPGTGE